MTKYTFKNAVTKCVELFEDIHVLDNKTWLMIMIQNPEAYSIIKELILTSKNFESLMNHLVNTVTTYRVIQSHSSLLHTLYIDDSEKIEEYQKIHENSTSVVYNLIHFTKFYIERYKVEIDFNIDIFPLDDHEVHEHLAKLELEGYEFESIPKSKLH